MKTLYCGNFAELQARFIADVSALRVRDPLAPLDVIVYGQLARLALRRELARAGCSHANVRFRTLHELAEHETEKIRRQQGLRTLPEMLHGPLMLRAIENASPLSYFGALSSREGFRTALWRTLDELRGAGLNGDSLARASDRKSTRSTTLGRKLRDLAEILLALEKLLREHHYADGIRTLELAGAGECECDEPLILYGIDEMSALERRFFEKQLRREPVTVYLPYRNDASFQWVRPLFDALATMGFAAEFLSESASAPDIFLVSAPTRDREVEEIASELLRTDEPQSAPARTGVLVRDSEPYVPLLRETLSQAGLSGYFHQCHTLGETATGRAFLLLSALLDLKFARADVTEFLLSSPVIWPEEMASERIPEPPAALWNQLTLLAGITSGEDAWRDGLRRLRNRLEREQQADADDDDARALPADCLEAVESLQRFSEILFRRLRDVRRARSWKDIVAGYWSLFSDLTIRSEVTESLRQEWEGMEQLDALKIAPTVENVRAQIHAVLTKPAEREGHFQTHEPTVATFGETQGILFDTVLIPGVVERELPRPVSQDPLLLDDERKLLAQWIGSQSADIPLRSDRRQRERFAFFNALTSARRRVVLLYPRRESGGRERLPSSYLLDVLEALTGQAADYDALNRYISSSAKARRVPASRLRSDQSFSPTSFARDLSRLGRALETQSSAPIADLVSDHPFFARAAAAEDGRFRRHGFSRYDGMIEDAALRERLSLHFAERAFSPTRMETYARCPFRFFALHVLDLNPVEEPEELSLISPLHRGLLIHWILERFFRDEQAADRLPLQRGAEERLMTTAQRAFAAFERELVTGPALLWRIEQKRIQRALRRFIEREFADDSGFIPHHFEKPFSFDFTDGSKISFHGKMDRVDVAPDGRARVVDYKSGKVRAGLKSGSLGGGQALQLPVYRLAVERALGLEGAVAVYYFLAEAAQDTRIEYTREHWETGRGIFAQTITTIFEGLTGGRYYPFPETMKCASCPVRTACGTGRFTLKWRRPSSTTNAFLEMREANA